MFDELFIQNFEKMKSPKIVSFRKSKNARIQNSFRRTKLMTFGRTGLTIGLFDGEFSNCEPLWGDGRKEQIEFDFQKYMRFRDVAIQQFCLFQAKYKIVE